MSTQQQNFDGLSVIITGSSAGLGRQYALDFGKSGANVLVHGRSSKTEDVAEEIRSEGGSAVAVICDAEDGELIFRTAIDTFGRVDALVHNAGIVRDKTFAKMNREKWDEVMRVQLSGAFAIVSMVYPHMYERSYGRIVLTSSTAGLHGNFGQANYSTAKAGIIGLTKTLAKEGSRRNVKINALAPWAATPMTTDAFPTDLAKTLHASKVSPYVLAMCHPSMEESGAIIEAGGGWAAKLRWERAQGLALTDEELTLETVLSRWSEVVQFDSNSDYPLCTDDTLPHFKK